MENLHSKYSDDEVQFGPLMDWSEDELEMMSTSPRKISTTKMPRPITTSTPAVEQPNQDKVLEAITKLSYGLEKQGTELQKQLHELTQRVESIELEKHEFGTSPRSEDRASKQSECLTENGPESCGDGFNHFATTKTVAGSCKSTSGLSKTKPVVRPAVFNGSTSWEDYKAQFELVASLNDWDKKTKATYLAVSLGGPAQAVLGDLDEDQRSDFNSLTSALENRFGTYNRKEMFRVSLRNRKRKPDESLPELAQAIRRLTRRAFPDVTADIRETMARDSFIDALSTAEERWKVHQTRPKTLNEALTVAVEQEAFFTADRQRNTAIRSVQPATDKSTEDLKQELAELKALVQQMASQKNSSITDVRNNQQRIRAQIECWSCGEKGHVQRKCPQLNKQKRTQSQGNDRLSGSRA